MCVFPTSVPPRRQSVARLRRTFAFHSREKSQKLRISASSLKPATSMLSLTATETFSSVRRFDDDDDDDDDVDVLLLFFFFFHVSNSSGRTKGESRGGDVFCSLESDDDDAFIANATIGTSAAVIAGKPRGFVRPRRDILLMCSQKVVTKKKERRNRRVVQASETRRSTRQL